MLLLKGTLDRLAVWVAQQDGVEAWLKDVRSRFISVSAPLARCCAVSPAAMIGRTEEDFFADAMVAQFRRDDRVVLARATSRVFVETSARGRYATLKRPLSLDGRRVLGTLGFALKWPAGMTEPPLPLDPPQPNEIPDWLRVIRDHIEGRFRERIRIASLACAAERHPNHVSRAFRRHFGMTLTEWTHRRRLAWAAEAIAAGEQPLGEIAGNAGFADQPHLTRVFRRYLGVTPNAYRVAMLPTSTAPMPRRHRGDGTGRDAA